MTRPVRDKRASEFGGRPGLIQPSPHEPTQSETLMQIYQTEPVAPPAEIEWPPSAVPPAIRPDEDPETFVPATERKR